MLIVHSDIIQAVDRGQLMALILLDLSSAFDTVDHDCLLSILRNLFSVDGSATLWFQSYLPERTQTFTASGSQSSPIELQCSVPQGSVVGPIQFTAYMEDVQDLFDRHRVSYTDVSSCHEEAGCKRLADCIIELQS